MTHLVKEQCYRRLVRSRLILLCSTVGLILGLTGNAVAAVRQVSAPVNVMERWTPTTKSVAISFDSEIGEATVSLPPALKLGTPVRLVPLGWSGQKILFRNYVSGRRGPVTRFQAVLQDDSVLWSVAGYSGTAKTEWKALPEGASPFATNRLTATFKNPALVHSDAIQAYVTGGSVFAALDLTAVELSPDTADAEAWRLAATKAKFRAARENVSCSFGTSNSAMCQVRYTIGTKRYLRRVEVSANQKALAKGQVGWSALDWGVRRIRPSKPALPGT